MGRVLTLITSVLLGVSMLIASPASAEDAVPISNTSRPIVIGTPQFGKTLTADPGTWVPAATSYDYVWLRNGVQVGTGPTYVLDAEADLHRTFVVQVVASDAGSSSEPATSDPTALVKAATFTNDRRPTITGSRKFRQKLTGHIGSWSEGGLRLTRRWYRNGKPIWGAVKSVYTLAPEDVGRRITFGVVAKKYGHLTVRAMSTRTNPIQHLRPVRKTVTYRVVTNGKITSSVATFKKQAAETFADPRGWRGMGVAFKRVKSGGDFTLVLSQASKVPNYSSGCSSTYSCRVGRYVIINQTRWQKATPAWKDHHGSLRNYRHLVVNHETGHWLGKGHATCSGKGNLASVMQQQSKGLHGCKINPWPKPSELHSPRFGY